MPQDVCSPHTDSTMMCPVCTVHAEGLFKLLTAVLQAEREAGPPTAEESVGTWFSNPATDHGSQQQHSGVGKYLKAQPVAKVAPLREAASDIPAMPPAKKPKQSAGGYGNFSSW